MKAVLILLLFCLPYCVIGQTIRIMDSLIIKKFNHDAVAIDVALTFPITHNLPLRINKMPRYVVSDPVVSYSLVQGNNNHNVGLIYLVEDQKGRIMPLTSYPGYPGFFPILSNPGSLHEKNSSQSDCLEKRFLLNEENMKSYYKNVSCDSIEYYDNQSLILSHPDTLIRIYPILSEKKLTPGQYKFYLYYCYKTKNGVFSNDSEAKQMENYYGEMFSNKVVLIIEDRPVRWWEFWRRRAR